MKILVVCQHYWPENFRVTEICEDLVARGHDVTALVGLPNYPTGIVPPEYKRFRNRKQERNGVHIRRCLEIGRRPGKVGLAINYVSYMLSACHKALWMKKDYDVIYAFSTSPVLMSLPAAFLRCFRKQPLMIYIMDIWPACLSTLNVPETALLYRVMKCVSKRIYGRADQLIYSSKRFQEYLWRVHGIRVADEAYMPQFADGMFEQALPAKAHDEEMQLVFAGNIGKMQGTELLLQAAALTKALPLRWHFVGGGASLENCRALSTRLGLDDRVSFYGQRPLQDMPEFYALADAMLVSMRNDPLVNDTLPGKVQTYMAAGKPVLGSIAGETPYVIGQSGCGLCAPPEDAEAFAAVVRRFFALEPQERARMGERGKAYYQAHFTKKRHMDRLEEMLTTLAKGGCGHARI